MGSSFSVGSAISMDCTTDLSALPAVADRQKMNPSRWNSGSPPLAMMTPPAMGIRVAYVDGASLSPEWEAECDAGAR
jgi:hypothetical protein